MRFAVQAGSSLPCVVAFAYLISVPPPSFIFALAIVLAGHRYVSFIVVVFVNIVNVVVVVVLSSFLTLSLAFTFFSPPSSFSLSLLQFLLYLLNFSLRNLDLVT